MDDHKPNDSREPGRLLDPLNDDDMNEWQERQFAAGVEQIKEQRRRLQALGILDENGRRVSKELPPEMLSGDKPDDVV